MAQNVTQCLVRQDAPLVFRSVYKPMSYNADKRRERLSLHDKKGSSDLPISNHQWSSRPCLVIVLHSHDNGALFCFGEMT